MLAHWKLAFVEVEARLAGRTFPKWLIAILALMLIGCWSLRFVAVWVSAYDYEWADYDHDPKDDYRAVVTLQQILLLQLAGFVAYLRGEKVPFQWSVWYISLYVMMSLFPVLGMILILRGRQHLPYGNTSKRHSQSRGVVVFTRASIVFSVALIFVFACAAGEGTFSRFEKHEIPIAKAIAYEWRNDYKDLGIKKGDAGVEVFFHFQPASLGKVVPEAVVVDLTLGPNVRRSWSIAEAMAYQGKYDAAPSPDEFVEGKAIDVPVVLRPEKYGKNQTRKLHWFGMKPDKTYTLRLLLHQDDKDFPTDSLLSILNGDKSSDGLQAGIYLEK